ncbi:hypothetical protein [Paracraurococcus lichenis]|uniref:YARHG domain-containing protein n=1 Tax=Paracraurococcus lichenis TaxID=3064888 RepID=A0ABT9DWW5_9PROT|nr:hypothetical protein [Paracraurococcus sp. LOR1-02]MDO9708395.1 hypothetical protein [Paracraurococcus sp. LOR1-02]
MPILLRRALPAAALIAITAAAGAPPAAAGNQRGYSTNSYLAPWCREELVYINNKPYTRNTCTGQLLAASQGSGGGGGGVR